MNWDLILKLAMIVDVALIAFMAYYIYLTWDDKA